MEPAKRPRIAYNPDTLQTLALESTAYLIQKYMDVEKLQLPKTIVESIQYIWKQTKLQPPTPEDVNYGEIDIANITTPKSFATLMNHPPEVPSSAYENNCVRRKYYCLRDDPQNENLRSLCLSCATYFIANNKHVHVNKPGGWLTARGPRLYHNSMHEHIIGEDILESLWNQDNWCDNCIKPLFQITDGSECSAQCLFCGLTFNDNHRVPCMRCGCACLH